MSAPVRVLVVDDEPVARRGMRALLARDPELDVVGEAANGTEAVERIRALAPEIVFLDVQMPELDGFGVVEAVGAERMPVTVFVTAYDQHALRAFEVCALDYLLKPFDDERFAAAVARAKRQARQERDGALGARLHSLLERFAPAGAGAAEAGPLERVLVRAGGRIVFLRTEEIDWIEAADYYARLHVGRETHLVRQSLSELERRLDPARFVRVHRSSIVNLDRIRAIEPYFRGDHILILADGTKVKLSRTRREALERVLGQKI